MKISKDLLDRKAQKWGILCFSILALLFYSVASCSSKADDNTVAPVSGYDVSKVPDDGQEHVIYTDNSGYKIKCKIIHLGHSYTSHIVWIETARGEMFAESLSTH